MSAESMKAKVGVSTCMTPQFTPGSFGWRTNTGNSTVKSKLPIRESTLAWYHLHTHRP
ncbi:hypothetical protein GCM10008938_23030 [Deinococcus roseus]|uniref:Uncharacterized protein n=1 Tax=Deinococcus roseus TaxID=392414 RepID=A0ABQ2D034_9DEIO|nr:hypothetical protein GCM10008938_23030 [Deinococcus roseus]